MNESRGKSTPVISISSYRILSIQYKHFASKSEFPQSEKPSIEMNYALSKDHQGGKAEMTAHVVKPLQYQVMDITVAGYYDFRKDVTKVDDQKKYLAINGGAMLYPYLRTIVSIITALDKTDSVVLPSLNFIDEFKRLKSGDSD